MKKNILVLFATIFILLLLSEAGARLWAVFMHPPTKYGDKGGYSYFPYLPYSPTADYSDLDSIRVLNSRGFRNTEEFTVPKADNTYRIICLGGSTTYDDYGGQNDNNIWTGRLEYYLNQNSKGKKYEVINASAHNYDTYMNLIDYMTRCRDLQPDLIVIFEGINEIYFNGFDSVNFAHTNVFQPFNFNYHNYFYNLNHNFFLKNSMFLRYIYIKLFISRLNLNVMATKTAHYYGLKNLKIAQSNSLFTFRKGLESFIAIAKADSSKLVFLSQAYNFENFRRYYESQPENKSDIPERMKTLKEETERVSKLMKEIADTNSIPFLDMNLIMNQQEDLFSGPIDNVHFSKKGSDFFGYNVYLFLKNQLLVD